MSLEVVPYCISADLHSAALFRQTLQDLLSGTGVLQAGDLEVIQHTSPELNVVVQPGNILIPGTQGGTTGQRANLGSQHSTYTACLANFTSAGVYKAYNSAAATLAIASADKTNPRIDLICASVQDAYYSGSNNQAILQVVTGTPSGSPSAPTPPENTVVLAQVEVKANATKIETAQITSERPIASAGGIATGQSYAVQAGIAVGTEYYGNGSTSSTPNRPYMLSVQGIPETGEEAWIVNLTVGGVSLGSFGNVAGKYNRAWITFIVPPNQKYVFASSVGTVRLRVMAIQL